IFLIKNSRNRGRRKSLGITAMARRCSMGCAPQKRGKRPDKELKCGLCAELCLLGELPDHHVALQLGQVVEEQAAVEMIDLVLQADGKHAVGLDLLRTAVAVEVG